MLKLDVKEKERLKYRKEFKENKELEREQKAKDRSKQALKREEDRKKMKEDMKKRLSKKGKAKEEKAQGSIEFEFVGINYDDSKEEEKESKDGKEISFVTKSDIITRNDEEKVVEMVQEQINQYSTNLFNFLDEENISDENEGELSSATPKFIPSKSEDRENVYNNGLDESQDSDSTKIISDLKVSK